MLLVHIEQSPVGLLCQNGDMKRGIIAGLLALSVGLTLGACAPEAPVAKPEVTKTVKATPTPTAHPGIGPGCPTDDCFTITATGDMLFHAGLWKPAVIPTDASGRNYDFMPLLQGQSAYLNKADVAICHQETPFTQIGQEPTGYPIFATPWELAVTEKAIGYDACDTSSNHTVDQGHDGVVRTLDVLDQNGLKHTGSYRTPEEANQVLIMDTPAGRVAFISATFSVNGNFNEFDWQVNYPLDPDVMIARAAQARAEGADVVIGVQHAGTEYSNEADIQQINNAHALIDSGQFDMVYGHHPHAIQPMELYNGKWIVYSLGNGISESSGDYPVNNEFLIIRAQFSKAKDGTWSVSDMAWAAATNKQDGVYRWCSVASDVPQGVCQSPEFDAGVRERTRATVNAMGAEAAGAHEWLVTQDK